MLRLSITDYLARFDCPFEYSGFFILCELIDVACDNYNDIKTNLKSIYLEVGSRLKISRLSIERNLRTLISVWSTRPKFKLLFEEIPTNARLVITLSYRIYHLHHSVYETLLLT